MCDDELCRINAVIELKMNTEYGNLGKNSSFDYSFENKQKQASTCTESSEMAEEKESKMEEVAKEDSSSSTMRFEIKKWNAVTMWSWDICADTCAICRNSLNEPSIEYQVCLHTNYFMTLWFYGRIRVYLGQSIPK